MYVRENCIALLIVPYSRLPGCGDDTMTWRAPWVNKFVLDYLGTVLSSNLSWLAQNWHLSCELEGHLLVDQNTVLHVDDAERNDRDVDRLKFPLASILLLLSPYSLLLAILNTITVFCRCAEASEAAARHPDKVVECSL